MSVRKCVFVLTAATLGLCGFSRGMADEVQGSGELVLFGTMREAIGEQQDHGRVRLGDLTERPHFYGVAALEKLQGEVTIFDGKITITTVNDQGGLQPAAGALADRKATLLVGSYVSSWSQLPVTHDVAIDEFDSYVADSANLAGVKTSSPFVFSVEGEFTDVHMHVINGACPIRARFKQEKIADHQRAYEAELASVKGKLVGVFARDAVGQLTHPATSTHAHLLYTDPDSGQLVTGHVEQIGLKTGSILRFPN